MATSLYLFVAFAMSLFIPVVFLDLNTKNCECGVFANKNITTRVDPMLHKIIMASECDEPAQEMCLKECINFANSEKEDFNMGIFCLFVPNSDIRVALFGRVCNGTWLFTGIEAKETVCCHNYVRINCTCVGDSCE